MIARGCVAALLAVSSAFAAPSEIRVSAANTIPAMRTVVSGEGYELRNATVADLIRTAWAVSAEDVVGGPQWLDTDRFDVNVPAPGASPERRQLLLRKMLRDRFGLVTHRRTEAVPAYLISVASRSQLQPGKVAAASGCDLKQNSSTAPGMPRPPDESRGFPADHLPQRHPRAIRARIESTDYGHRCTSHRCDAAAERADPDRARVAVAAWPPVTAERGARIGTGCRSR